MRRNNRISLDPVPDIHTHDFTIYALNELYDNQIVLEKKIKKVRRGSNIKYFLLSAACGYIYSKVKKLEESNNK